MKPQIRIYGRLAMLLAALGLAVSTLVGGPQAASAKDQILTQKTVELFLASYPDVKAIAERHAKQKGDDISGSTDQLSAVIQAASDEAVVDEIDGTVKSHGFTGAQQWLSVASSVGRAYAYIRSGVDVSKANKKLEKAIAKIEKNGFLNDKQKGKLIKALREGAGEFLEEPPAENIAAVQPMTGDIDAIVLQ
jgi:hypothetical protein